MRLYILWKFWRELCFHIIIIFAILNVGCIHLRHIRQDSLRQKLNKINEELAGKRAQLVLVGDPKKLTVETIHLSPYSVYYVETKTNNQERIDISNVYRIITKNHGQGAVEGLLGGLLIWGSLVGVSLLLVTAFPDDPSVEDGPGGGLLVYIAIKGGAPLPILGTLIGEAAASKNIYDFNDK